MNNFIYVVNKYLSINHKDEINRLSIITHTTLVNNIFQPKQ